MGFASSFIYRLISIISIVVIEGQAFDSYFRKKVSVLSSCERLRMFSRFTAIECNVRLSGGIVTQQMLRESNPNCEVRLTHDE